LMRRCPSSPCPLLPQGEKGDFGRPAVQSERANAGASLWKLRIIAVLTEVEFSDKHSHSRAPSVATAVHGGRREAIRHCSPSGAIRVCGLKALPERVEAPAGLACRSPFPLPTGAGLIQSAVRVCRIARGARLRRQVQPCPNGRVSATLRLSALSASRRCMYCSPPRRGARRGMAHKASAFIGGWNPAQQDQSLRELL